LQSRKASLTLGLPAPDWRRQGYRKACRPDRISRTETPVWQDFAMSRTLSQAWRYAPALAAVVIVLGCVAEVNAYPQRRGRVYIPRPPANIDSSPMIDGLNKALKTLSAIDYSFDGHLPKAIEHIQAAIHDLQVPNASAKGKTGSAAEKASAGAANPATKTATTPPADSGAILHKAKTELYAIYHKLNDKDSTKGRIHAGAEVLIAIQELTSAEKILNPAAAPASKPASKPAPANPLSKYMIK
jgi:hypothetical protein